MSEKIKDKTSFEAFKPDQSCFPIDIQTPFQKVIFGSMDYSGSGNRLQGLHNPQTKARTIPGI